MAIIALDNLETGMTLKSDVKDRNGRLLLPAGTELSDKHLRIFRTWGVSEADIEGGESDVNLEGPAPICGDPAAIAEAQEYFNNLFIRNDLQHPLMQELIRICVARKVADAG